MLIVPGAAMFMNPLGICLEGYKLRSTYFPEEARFVIMSVHELENVDTPSIIPRTKVFKSR